MSFYSLIDYCENELYDVRLFTLKMAPKFIFLRHGEAEHNVAFHQTGTSVFTDSKYEDAPLTEKGIAQAVEARKQLSSLKILDVWCSPLTRCLQTALEVFEEVNVEDMYVHDSLIERQGGGHVCNTRKPKGELKKHYPFFDMKSIPELPSLWVERESEYILYQRLFMFMKLLENIYKDEDSDSYVLIVGHGDAFQTFLGKSLKNAEYVIMSLEEILRDK